jgi:hypothetical protein
MVPPPPDDDRRKQPPRPITRRRPRLTGGSSEEVMDWVDKMEQQRRLSWFDQETRLRQHEREEDDERDDVEPLVEPGLGIIAPDLGEERKTIKKQVDWLASERMTSTEVLLRVAMQLIEQKLVKGDVRVALRGLEVTRAGRPRFPVESFLNRYDFKRWDTTSNDWRDRYSKMQVEGSVILTDDPETDPQLSARLHDKRRLVLEAAASAVTASRTSAEHRILYGLMGRAIGRADLDRSDVLAVAVPRNPRMKKLTVLLRGSDRVEAAGIHFFLVNRVGPVDGLQVLAKNRDR